MYPGKQVWDKVDGQWVTVSNPAEAVKRDPDRYSLRQPAPEPIPEPSNEGEP